MLDEEKQALRRAVRRQIAAFSPKYLRDAGEKIAARLDGCPEYRQARTVLGFVSMATEIDTLPFLRRTMEAGKRLTVPLCTAPGRMEARLIRGMDDLRPGSYGILEPGPECPRLAPAEIEFAVIPCVACDRQGNRLGHGGGYYDRYLAVYTGPAALVCPEALLQRSIPTGPLDRPIGLVVTETAMYRDGIMKI
ncbi:5-formyltetrahydrofolate cyclo-ligase [uncultured Dysosmobacter sp.]|uniref:5-formyltetrahydrofolate cyclo-ligase n=1 Tax=uncultured Dysosmobacter sp. TaxID=2591384 RepID=UPI002601D15B|nr:5-formyltetrahydrofolate cyclo-ligase [uncultured Dysosmobacter sp.]